MKTFTDLKQELSEGIHPAAEAAARESHELWRKDFHKNNPGEANKPRMRERGGQMVDVNQPWEKLHPAAKKDNVHALNKYIPHVKRNLKGIRNEDPRAIWKAGEHIHKEWMRMNKKTSENAHLHVPYHKLPPHEQVKDDNIAKSLAKHLK